MLATKRRLKILARRKALRERRLNGDLPHGTPYARYERMKILGENGKSPVALSDDARLDVQTGGATRDVTQQ